MTTQERLQQLDLYKGIRNVTRLLPRQKSTTAVMELIERIISELKKEDCDQALVSDLSGRIQLLANAKNFKS